jgi:tyrosinase
MGTLEREPHGTVYGEVGGDGPPELSWMSYFETAARDPIFWLHHANIDRLWEAWLALGDGRANPSGRRADPWLNSWFKVGGGASAVTLRVREVLDTGQPPLNYFYSDISVPEPARAAVLATSSDTDSEFAEEEQVPQDISPEMVGASETRVPLAATRTEVEVAIEAPSGPALRERAEGAQTRKVYLQVENVQGRELAAPNYSVYVNLPPRADPTEDEDRRVGQVSMFGVREASRSEEGHSGSGLTFSFDITGVVEHLEEAGEWAPERLRVTFAPVRPSAEQGGDVSVGQVSLFYV